MHVSDFNINLDNLEVREVLDGSEDRLAHRRREIVKAIAEYGGEDQVYGNLPRSDFHADAMCWFRGGTHGAAQGAERPRGSQSQRMHSRNASGGGGGNLRHGKIGDPGGSAGFGFGQAMHRKFMIHGSGPLCARLVMLGVRHQPTTECDGHRKNRQVGKGSGNDSDVLRQESEDLGRPRADTNFLPLFGPHKPGFNIRVDKAKTPLVSKGGFRWWLRPASIR